MGKITTTTTLHEPSYTIAGFCRVENISQPTYYKLKAMGLGPKEMRFPGINAVRISHRDRLEWQEMMRNPTGEHAAAVQQVIERQQQKSRMAAAKAKDSPLHGSRPDSPARRR